MSKPVVVFSNFWHVDSILENGYYLHRLDDKKVVRIAVENPANYSVYSIALSHPPLTHPRLTHIAVLGKLGKFKRLDFFCPTYDTLKDYQKNRDWDAYRKHYLNILKDRTDKIKEWVGDLKPDHIYFLCCWENTSKGAKCHRQIAYEVFRDSKSTKNSIISLYCHGNELGKEHTEKRYTEDGSIVSVNAEPSEDDEIVVRFQAPNLASSLSQLFSTTDTSMRDDQF